MKLFLEVREIVSGLNEIAESITADITGKTSAEIESIKADIQAIMVDRTYRLERHTCGHDEGKGCVFVEEV